MRPPVNLSQTVPEVYRQRGSTVLGEGPKGWVLSWACTCITYEGHQEQVLAANYSQAVTDQDYDEDWQTA